MKHIQAIVWIFYLTILTGCPLVRGTGDAVQATGEGVAHAVEGTGDAIGRTSHEITHGVD